MGEDGYSILIWDGYGWGLVKKNPRLYSEGIDMYGNPQNWWPCSKDTKWEDIVRMHGLDHTKTEFRIIRDRE